MMICSSIIAPDWQLYVYKIHCDNKDPVSSIDLNYKWTMIK